MNLTNAIVGDEAIGKVSNQHSADKLEKGFEFGTWEFPVYFDFFAKVGGLKKDDFGDNYIFDEKTKKKICRRLKKEIARFKLLNKDERKNGKNRIFNYIKRKNAKDWRIDDGHLNPYTSYAKEKVALNIVNPLDLNSVKWYKKLLSIFNCKVVKIVRM